ncbi:MAG: YkgJ family cysteine cluster protein [Desulfomonile sp.]|nr:YkgJ family cysteine cluster protein [Desulfomonile sp.]
MSKDFNRADWDFFKVALKEEAREAIWKVGASVEPQTLIESVLEEIQELAPHPESGDTRTDEQVWTQIRELLLKTAYATRPHCIKCGKCCTSGSPTLTKQDMDLFVKDVLTPKHVITIRTGEPVYSNVTEQAANADHELIKIREKQHSRTCIFYQDLTRTCSIYDSRPRQCVIQECWNPSNYYQIAQEPKLDRKAILEPTGYFWEVIERHDERCSHAELARLMARLGATKGHTIDDVLALLQMDHEVRLRAAERFQLAPDTLDFFFGRPLREVVFVYGLKVEAQPDGTFLVTAQ